MHRLVFVPEQRGDGSIGLGTICEMESGTFSLVAMSVKMVSSKIVNSFYHMKYVHEISTGFEGINFIFYCIIS